jgi:hypothetical protein
MTFINTTVDTNAHTISAASTFSNSVLNINGATSTLDVNGRMRINGEFLDERLERIEKVLGIPPRNIEMEEKYPKLKKIYDEYINELAKYTTWDKLK